MRPSANHLQAVACACAFVASTAIGGTTTWINPNGGAWNDAANWSDGVPDAADSAVFPALRSGAYAVSLPTGAVAASVTVGDVAPGSAVTFVGGSLSIVGALAVADGTNGALVLDGATVQSASTLVGASAGSGNVRVQGGSTLGSSYLTCGQSGDGVLDVAADAKLVAGTLVLGGGSTLRLEFDLPASPIAFANTMERGGALEIVASPTLGLPTPAVPILLQSWGGLSGSFVSKKGPVVQGFEAKVLDGSLWIGVDENDPVVSLDLVLNHTPIYVGITYDLTIDATRFSGLAFSCGSQCRDDFTVTAGSSVLSPSGGSKWAVPVPDAESFTLAATFLAQPTPVSASIEIVPRDDYPTSYEFLATRADGELANADDCYVAQISGEPRSTGDGRFVVFSSRATNLVPGVTTEAQRIYVKDRATGLIEIASIDTGVVAAYLSPDISDDGRYVVFQGSSPERHVWIRDRWRGVTRLVTHLPDGSFPTGASRNPRISTDGTTVVFESDATQLLAGVVAPAVTQIYAYDVATDTLSAVSLNAKGQFANAPSFWPTPNHDGSLVSFRTQATNLVDDNAGQARLVLASRATNAFERVDVSTDGVAGDGGVQTHAMTPSARYVAFRSTSNNLGAPPDDGKPDVFVRDLLLKTTTCVSAETDPVVSNSAVDLVNISDNGAYVIYGLPNGATGDPDVFLRRVRLPTLESDWAAASLWGGPLPLAGFSADLTADGETIFCNALPDGYVPFYDLWADGYCRLLAQRRVPFATEDFNRDGLVNGADLSILLAAWGSDGPGDLNGDGTVGAADLALLLAAWTPAP
jgi:hypothetical protein